MAKVLIIFAHPAYERSRVGRRLLEAVRPLENVTVHDLYEAYPEFDVDPARSSRSSRPTTSWFFSTRSTGTQCLPY